MLGGRQSWEGSVLTGQVRDDEVVLSGMERKGLIQMLSLLDIGGGHSLMRRKRSLRNRESWWHHVPMPCGMEVGFSRMPAGCPLILTDPGRCQDNITFQQAFPKPKV